jgi:hypothetical protein
LRLTLSAQRFPTARAVGYEYAVGFANWLNAHIQPDETVQFANNKTAA